MLPPPVPRSQPDPAPPTPPALQWSASQIEELKVHLEGLLEDRRCKLQENIDALNARVAKLEAQFEADKEQTLKEIAERNAELTHKLEDFEVRAGLHGWV